MPSGVPSGSYAPPIASSSRPAPRIPEAERASVGTDRETERRERDGDGDDVHVDGRRSRSPAPPSPPPPTTTLLPPRAESMSRSPGPRGGEDATPGARRTAISKVRKHELIEELTERGMDAGGVVKELRDRLRAAREVGGWRGDE